MRNKDEYFNFEFNVKQNNQVNQAQFTYGNVFENRNTDDWFDWQHNELDTDDSYEYEQYFKVNHPKMKFLVSPLAKYEYLKNVAEKQVHTLEQGPEKDDQIFKDLANYLQNKRQKLKREQSIIQSKEESIQTHRNVLISQLKQKKIFIGLLSNKKPRKSLGIRILEDIDENIQLTLTKLTELEDIEFIDNIQAEINSLNQIEIQKELQDEGICKQLDQLIKESAKISIEERVKQFD